MDREPRRIHTSTLSAALPWRCGHWLVVASARFACSSVTAF